MALDNDATQTRTSVMDYAAETQQPMTNGSGMEAPKGLGPGYDRAQSAGALTGQRVVNPTGEDLGKIGDIMIDVPTGKIAYAILSVGGFLGVGDKSFAVPWEALTFDERKKQFILNVDKKQLENAPEFTITTGPTAPHQA